jgi:hypothetical protein
LKKNILMIPDSHLKPGVAHQRFKWLGNLISDRKPDIVVQIGDLWDMESLCSYDYGTIHAENRRYRADLEAGWAGLECLNDNIVGVDPECYLTFGNHEHRVSKTIEKNPALHGHISMEDFRCEDFGWTSIPFMTPLVLQGITFCHYFIGGNMGKPIGGEYQAANTIKKQHVSTVCGHSHLLDFAQRTSAQGVKIQALVGGCFLEPGQWERYAGQANFLWHNGVCMLNDAEDGNYDLEVISTERLKRKYG